MSVSEPLAASYVDFPEFMPRPPLFASFDLGWANVQIAHYRQSGLELPEVTNSEHGIVIPLGHDALDMEFFSEGRVWRNHYRKRDYANGCIEVHPAHLPYKLRCVSKTAVMEWLKCHVEPTFVAQVAHESVNPDRVELILIHKKVDPLIYQIGLALKSSLEIDGGRNGFYVDSMATALSAHLLRYYSTRNHHFRAHEDGLSQPKLRRAIDYMRSHLNENLSLSAIAEELGMSHYYFCRLFKQSLGISPHQYLMQQRIEKAKHLLKKSQQTVTSISLECGFANQSHFAKSFHKWTRMNPQEFRNL